MTDNPERQGDVTKLWLTTPTYNVYREVGLCSVLPREGMPGAYVTFTAEAPSLYQFVHDTLTPFIAERFTSGVIEFDTGEQIRFDVPTIYSPAQSWYMQEARAKFCDWKIRGSTYGGRWADANDVDDATLIHRAITTYQAYREERKERGDE